MQIYKKIRVFITLICVIALLFSVCIFSVEASGTKSVTATTVTSIKQGNSGTCYVYIDSTESIAVLDVAVHFDAEKIKINNVYNSVNCVLYDSVKNIDNVQFSYIFDGVGTTDKTQLFYFTYQVLSNADVGDTYFDITIGEAYDSGLNDIAVSGSRTSFTVTETLSNKSCSIYGTSSVSTSVDMEFVLDYQFSTYQIASGSAVITYDPELFEVISVTNGGFLNDKITDINTGFSGSVYISFVGTEYNTQRDLVSVKFKTLKNVSESSEITLKTTELCDKELNSISCNPYTTTANIAYDDTYIGDAPKMYVVADYNKITGKAQAKILLEKNSMLGAGDFVVKFDPEILTLNKYEKSFTPNFFNINDKQISEGILKFSIISLNDIVAEQNVLTLEFDVKLNETQHITNIDVAGSMLSDSLTNPIKLNFIDASLNIPKAYITGDLNGDGSVNILDLARLKKILAGAEEEFFTSPDIDSDGNITAKDLTVLMEFILADFKK